MLLDQTQNPLLLTLALVPRFLSPNSLALLISLALELLHNNRVGEGVALDFPVGYVVQRVVERVLAGVLAACNLNAVDVVVDDTQNLAGFRVALNSSLTELELACGLLGAAFDVERVLVLREFFLVAGKTFATTGRGVQLVHQTQALVVLC
jgi:hypothetical protein